jgi:putative endonuclease
MKRKGGTTYIMSSPDKTALYTGVSSHLENRVLEHKTKVHPKSFTARYNCVLLVYFKYFESIEEAIAEEKRIKGGSRLKKVRLIESMNPNWYDLFDEMNKHQW